MFPAMFMDPPSDVRRLPVVLLSGFLGSGKTTLVNALLRDPRLADTAVAVNEFGEIPLDQHLIAHGEDQTVVLANGCLCCRLAGDFEDAVMRVFSRRAAGALPRFARLIVEPSGLADPAPIAQAILRNPVMAGALRLEAIVTAVDAVLAGGQIARHPEIRKQIGLADRIVLTKTDLAGPALAASAEAAVRRLNPAAPILSAIAGAIDPEELLPPRFLDAAAASSGRARSGLFADLIAPDAQTDGGAAHGERTEAVSLLAASPLRWREFDTWLRGIRIGHADSLLRVKAMLNIAGRHGPVVVQGVEHVVHAPVALDDWPDGDVRSRIVLITRGAPPGAIAQSWNRALPAMLAAT